MAIKYKDQEGNQDLSDYITDEESEFKDYEDLVGDYDYNKYNEEEDDD